MALKRTKCLGWTKAMSQITRQASVLHNRGDQEGAQKLHMAVKAAHTNRAAGILQKQNSRVSRTIHKSDRGN